MDLKFSERLAELMEEKNLSAVKLSKFKNPCLGNSPVVQWLGLYVSPTEGLDLIPGW